MSDDVTTLSSNASCRPSLKVLLVLPLLVLLLLLVLVLLVLVLLLLLLVLVLLLLVLVLLLVLAIGLQWQWLCGRPDESSRAVSWSVAQVRPLMTSLIALIATDDLPCMQVLTTALCVERGTEARLLLLALVGSEHLLLLGPPGTLMTSLMTADDR